MIVATLDVSVTRFESTQLILRWLALTVLMVGLAWLSISLCEAILAGGATMIPIFPVHQQNHFCGPVALPC